MTSLSPPARVRERADAAPTPLLTVGTPPPIPWLVQIRASRLSAEGGLLEPRTRILKRILDVVVASALLILAAPLMAIVALLVRLTSSGPVIYRQIRVGREQRRTPPAPTAGADSDPALDAFDGNADRREPVACGQPFVMYKFHTMYVNSEPNGARFACRKDPRVTPIGRFLRRTRIDELPQLWNVLRGDMSMVGPRPERPEFTRELADRIPEFLDRLQVKPGLTGLAQVVGGYESDLDGFRRKIALDLLYLRHCCLRNDLKILLRTVRTVVTGDGAV